MHHLGKVRRCDRRASVECKRGNVMSVVAFSDELLHPTSLTPKPTAPPCGPRVQSAPRIGKREKVRSAHRITPLAQDLCESRRCSALHVLLVVAIGIVLHPGIAMSAEP